MKWNDLKVSLVVATVILASSLGTYFASGIVAANTTEATITNLITTTSYATSTVISKTTITSNPIGNSSSIAIDPVSIYNRSFFSVVTVQGEKLVSTPYGTTIASGLGSGFVVKYEGAYYVVTNYHVVGGEANLTVTFSGGNVYAAAVRGSDPYSDLSVVSVVSAPTSEYHPLNLSKSSNLNVGQAVLAIGSPFGLSSSMSFGIVSQLGRTIQETTSGNFSIAGVIQFSAPINPGNSGGPLIESNGGVVGITTAVVGGSQGLGFAIPSDTINRELASLVVNGSYNRHSYLGILGSDMNYQLSRAMRVNVTYGVLTGATVNGGPAALAGLKGGNETVSLSGRKYVVGGDIIVSVNGTKILNNDYLSTFLEQNSSPGQIVNIGILRSNSSVILELKLGARPPPLLS